MAPPGPTQKIRCVRLPISPHICKDKKVGAAQAIQMAKGQKQGSWKLWDSGGLLGRSGDVMNTFNHNKYGTVRTVMEKILNPN